MSEILIHTNCLRKCVNCENEVSESFQVRIKARSIEGDNDCTYMDLKCCLNVNISKVNLIIMKCLMQVKIFFYGIIRNFGICQLDDKRKLFLKECGTYSLTSIIH